MAGLKGYVANLAACADGTPVTDDFVIGACHRLNYRPNCAPRHMPPGA